jgi:hypothetical protein
MHCVSCCVSLLISIAPSIMSGGEHIRTGSPDPLPVPPPHHKNGYRGDRTHYREPERPRSQRRRDYDPSHGYANGGEVRVRDVACEYHPTSFDVTLPCLSTPVVQPRASTNIPGEHISRSMTRHVGAQEHPDFQFSRCTGRKKAVCVSLQCQSRISLWLICTQDRN